MRLSVRYSMWIAEMRLDDSSDDGVVCDRVSADAKVCMIEWLIDVCFGVAVCIGQEEWRVSRFAIAMRRHSKVAGRNFGSRGGGP